MPDQLLTIETTRLAAGNVRLRLTGDLDYDTAPELQRMLDRTGLSELLAEAYADDDVRAIG